MPVVEEWLQRVKSVEFLISLWLQNFDEWIHCPLWKGNSAEDNVTYNLIYKRVKMYMDAAGVHVNKVTHAFRVAAARYMDEAGVDDEVS